MAKNQNNNVAPATKKTGAEAKKDALATALAQIEKQFGKGAVMKLGDNAAMQVEAISTGSRNITLANLASPELVTDEAFHLIVCALLLAKYGDAILNFERR